ncbi:hypothetical protein [uncultured Tessaracoccus sp.]|uniref:hypothetical protein n=1 Tax=uncultured Tessaracoccus sp. TaxID=905023 RepID=UPI00262409D0|nr:hypothetical protein [uncultured Tessaracoccus sp.]
MSVLSRYSRVREADGSEVSVEDALSLINSTLAAVMAKDGVNRWRGYYPRRRLA